MQNKDIAVTVSQYDDDYLWCEENCDGCEVGDDEATFIFKNVRGYVLEELEDRFGDDVVIL